MEIERKFLVNKALWGWHDPGEATLMQQAYLSSVPDCSVRIRIAGNCAMITIKGRTKGISREEFEYEIPLEDGLEIIKLAKTPVVIKHRFVVEYMGFDWEVDEFMGDNEGLILAEVELEKESDHPEWPEWIDREVSGDRRYYNSQLAVNPIKNWI